MLAGVRALGRLVRQRRGRLLLFSLLGVCLYQVLLLAPFVAYGALPNYFRLRGVWTGIVESVKLRPPPGALWELIADQPVYEFGATDRLGFVALQFVATTHSLITMLVLPLLVALLAVLLIEVRLALRGTSGPTARALGLSIPTVASLFGASTSAAACCGASSGPVLLTLLGVGFGTASMIVEHAEIIEATGFGLLVANVLTLSGWLARRPPGPGGLVAIPDETNSSMSAVRLG
jgi:hypothetical protein